MKHALISIVLLLTNAMGVAAETKSVSLSPVPYEIQLPEAMADKLIVEAVTGAWAEDVKTAGADAASVVFYRSDEGVRAVLMSVYLFPEDKFDAAQNPNEPPSFGREVIRKGGKVLSVAGPQDTIFDPGTVDARNVIESNTLIYEPQNYLPTN